MTICQDPMTSTAAVTRKGKGRLDWGPCPQTPRIYRIVLSQANAQNRRGEPRSPSAWSSPGVGAQVASLQSPTLRPGQHQCTQTGLAGLSREPQTQTKRRSSRGRVSSPQTPLSGSPRIGIKTRFQAHSPLESNIDFRLTFGLENACSALASQRFRNVSFDRVAVR